MILADSRRLADYVLPPFAEIRGTLNLEAHLWIQQAPLRHEKQRITNHLFQLLLDVGSPASQCSA